MGVRLVVKQNFSKKELVEKILELEERIEELERRHPAVPTTYLPVQTIPYTPVYYKDPYTTSN